MVRKSDPGLAWPKAAPPSHSLDQVRRVGEQDDQTHWSVPRALRHVRHASRGKRRMYDGPMAIKPLTVTPKPQQSVPPNTVCNFEHQCYPEKGGPAVKVPVAPPVAGTQPVAPRPTVPEDPLVAAWRDCVGQALQNYEQSHDVHALQVATGSCQVRLEAQGDENFAGGDPRCR
jgi:hypothetical protein